MTILTDIQAEIPALQALIAEAGETVTLHKPGGLRDTSKPWRGEVATGPTYSFPAYIGTFADKEVAVVIDVKGVVDLSSPTIQQGVRSMLALQADLDAELPGLSISTVDRLSFGGRTYGIVTAEPLRVAGTPVAWEATLQA